MAQLVAHLHGMERVRGSNPLSSTDRVSGDFRKPFFIPASASQFLHPLKDLPGGAVGHYPALGHDHQPVGLGGLIHMVGDEHYRHAGGAVELTDGAELTWMRQPHYYMGLYSYTYSAGLTIATQVCKRIENEGRTAVDDWKRVLKAGGTKTPVELAAMAGIDITTDAPLLDTIETIGAMIDEICELTDELEDK